VEKQQVETGSFVMNVVSHSTSHALHVARLAGIELLTIKIRLLLIASVDKAMELGINRREQDSYLSNGKKVKEMEKEKKDLEKWIKRLDEKVN
jgi:hypothetical protein